MAELSLNSQPIKTINDFIKEVAVIDNVNARVEKLNEFVKKLEEEMNKVEAFKRELPLCMLLLNDVIRGLKDEVIQCTTLSNPRPRQLEELVLLKKESDGESNSDNKENECVDKRSWIGSLKLCSGGENRATSDSICNLNGNAKLETKGCDWSATGDFFKRCSDLSDRGAFVPFNPFSGFPASGSRKVEKGNLPVTGLSLLTPDIESRRLSCSIGSKISSGSVVTSYGQTVQSQIGSQQPLPARKQRRCWSPELHRRFVNSLQQLGGAQVATPKQIRELMRIDGLTNDEVKSHLQKYRLHTRRLPSATASSANQSLVVLGGSRMSQDQYGDSSKASIPNSGSPQGPLQLAGNSGGTSTTGNSMEDNEDDKSDSYSWKSRIYKPGKGDV